MHLAGLGRHLLFLMSVVSVLFGLVYYYIFLTINKEEAFRSDELKHQLTLIVEGIRGQVPASLDEVLEERHLSKAPFEEQMRFLDSYLSEIAFEIIRIPIATKAGFYLRDKDRVVGVATSAIPLQWPSGVGNSKAHDDEVDTEVRMLVREQAIQALDRGVLQFATRDFKDHTDWVFVEPLSQNRKDPVVIWVSKSIPRANLPMRGSKRILLGIVLGAVAMGFGGLVVVISDLRRRLRWIRVGLDRLGYDLSYRLPEMSGEFGEITTAVNSMSMTLSYLRSTTELILEQIDDGVVILDEKGMVQLCNPAAERLIQRKSADVLKQHYRWVFEPQGMVGPIIDQAFQNGFARQNRIEYPSSPNKPIPLSVSAQQIVGKDGVPKGLVLLLRDLRQLEDLERRLHQADKLVALGRLVAGVAHEIRNPIGIIKSRVQLWQRKLPNVTLTPEAMAMVVQQVDRLNEIVTKLLYFSQSKSRINAFKRLHVHRVLQQVLEMVSAQAEEQRVYIQKEFSAEVPEIEMDALGMEQVFLNICFNALQAMPEGGLLLVATTYDPGAALVQIHFRDSGPGIPEDVGLHVFDPFFTTKAEGIGLGLSIAYEITASHGGHIGFQSPPEGGAIFTVTLPTVTVRVV